MRQSAQNWSDTQVSAMLAAIKELEQSFQNLGELSAQQETSRAAAALKIFAVRGLKESALKEASHNASPTGLAAHDLVARGIGVADAKQVMKGFTIINEKQFYSVLGITARTMQRRAASADKTLDANATDRTLRLISVTQQATGVFGSQEAAERWLCSPAMGLDQRTPIDLLQSSEGTAMVKTLLSRMEYGVYA